MFPEGLWGVQQESPNPEFQRVDVWVPGADPQRENFEPLFFREEEECCDEEREDEDDEGYIPGTTPLNMAATSQVCWNISS